MTISKLLIVTVGTFFIVFVLVLLLLTKYSQANAQVVLPDTINLDGLVDYVSDMKTLNSESPMNGIVTVGGPVPFIARDGEDGPIVQWVAPYTTHRPLGVKPEGARWVEPAVCDRRHCDE